MLEEDSDAKSRQDDSRPETGYDGSGEDWYGSVAGSDESDPNPGNPDLRRLESNPPPGDKPGPSTGSNSSLYTEAGGGDLGHAPLKLGSRKKSRGMLYMYATSSIISLAISSLGLVTLMLPQGVLSWIETKIDAVTNQMVDKATDRILSSYMKNVVGPRAKTCGTNTNLTCTVKVEGDGYIRSVFRTVQQAQAEDILAKRDIFINYNRVANGGAGSYRVITPNNPAGFELSDIGEGSFDLSRFDNAPDIGPREAYKAIKGELKVAFEGETRIKKFLKVRYHLGVLKEKYKLKKCAILCAETDTAARKIVDNRIVNKYKTLKVKLVSKFNSRLGIFMDCMLKSGSCSEVDFNSDNESIKNSLKDLGLDADNLDSIDFDNVDFKALAKELEYAESRSLKGGVLDAIKTKKELLIKKLLTFIFEKIGVKAPAEMAEKVGTKLFPVIGQILLILMIVDFMSRAEDGATNMDGWLVKAVDGMKLANLIDAYRLMSQTISESKLGGLSLDEFGSLMTDLSSLGTSRIFQKLVLGKSDTDIDSYQEDCPNSGSIQHGKAICQEYALKYLPNVAQVYADSPLNTLADFGLSQYRKDVLAIPFSGLFVEAIDGLIPRDSIPSFLKRDECNRLSTCDIYRSLVGAANWTVQEIMERIPGVSWLTEKFGNWAAGIIERLGVADFIYGILGKIAPQADCTDSGSANLANCVFGGAFRTSMDSNRERFGAPKQDSVAFREEYKLAMENQIEDFRSLSLKDRIFSISNPRSLVSRLAQSTTFDNNKLGALAFNPVKQLSFAYSSASNNVFLNPSAYAQNLEEEADYANAFGDDEYFWPSGVIDSASQEEIENCGVEGTPQHATCPLYFGITELFSSEFVEATGSSSASSGGASVFIEGQRGPCPGVASTRPNSGKPKNDIPVQIVPGTSIDIFEGYCKNALDMITAAKAAGVIMDGGGFRTYEEQINLRRSNCGSSNYSIYEAPSSSCSPPTAKPGTSNHEAGLAIDFSYGGQTLCFKRSTCEAGENPAYDWLVTNAGTYGFKKLKSEAWHWSANGN